jgi:periplasmic divalent cation tolerance protein
MTASAEDELIDVTVTGPNVDMMADLVRGLVEAGLAACGNVIPGVRSVYTWQGRVEDDSEVLAIVHTRREIIDQVMSHIVDRHPDDTPQILAIPVSAALPAYRTWLIEATSR